jgi:non-ribosomal peptide synthetase component F
MAVTNVLFHKYTGLNDILIGTAVSGRNTAILQQQVGLYIDTVPLRTQIDPAGSLLDLVTIIRAELTEVLDHQAFPFSMMERERADGPMDCLISSSRSGVRS